MDNLIYNIINLLNKAGRVFCDFSLSMFVQVSVLIVVLFIVDIQIRKRVRATFRYCIWMLVFVKLILPSGLSLPTGIGNFFGEYLVINSSDIETTFQNIDTEPVIASRTYDSENPARNEYTRPLTISSEIPLAPQIFESKQPTEPIIAAAQPTRTNSITWHGATFLIWFVGILVLTVLLIQRLFFVRGLIAQSEPAKNRLLDTLEECRKQLGIKKNIQMKLSYNASSPAVCGLFKPVILIPTNILNKISHEQLKVILIHELSHIKRADLLVNCAQTILQILYFYNPLLWLANSIVRKIREQAVDEMVLVALGADFGELSRTEAKSYTNTLIDVAEMAFSRPVLSLRLVGVVESKKALSERIKHILSRPFPKSAKLGILGIVVIVLAAFILLPMAKADKLSETNESFIAVLPNDVTVELVGVCELPDKKGKWWRPDGSELKILDIDDGRNTQRGMNFTTGNDRVTRHFAFKIKNQTTSYEKIKTKHEITPCYDNGLDGPISKNGIPLSEIWLVGGAISNDVDKCNIKFAVSTNGSEYYWIGFENVSLKKGIRTNVKVEKLNQSNSNEISPSMFGTWFFNNPEGDDEQMAIFPDRRVVVIYSNGHKDETIYYDGYIELAEYGGAKFKTTVLEDGTLLQYKDVNQYKNAQGIAKLWQRISALPQTTLLKPLTLSSEKEQKFTATLPNGVNVELLGICKDPSDSNNTWWKPNGTGMEELDFDLRPRQSFNVPVFSYVLKFSPFENINYRSKITNPEYLFHNSSAVSNEGLALIKWGDSLPLREELPGKTDIKVEVAAGQWEVNKPGGNSIYDEFTKLPDNKTIILSGLRSNEGAGLRTLIEATTNSFNVDIELECITKDGKIYKSTSEGSLISNDNMIQHTLGFYINLDEIEKINVKYRKFYQVTFNNVPLLPSLRLRDAILHVGEGISENIVVLPQNPMKREGPNDTSVNKNGIKIGTERILATEVTENTENNPDSDKQSLSYEIPNIFILRPSNARISVFEEVIKKAGDWTWNKTGREHLKKSYDEIFDGTHNRTDNDILVLVFSLDSADRIPAEYGDLLPQNWSELQNQLQQREVVELYKKTRGLNVIVLAVSKAEMIQQAIDNSEFLNNPKLFAQSPIKGSDITVEDFDIRYDSELAVYYAVASIKNIGKNESPYFIVNFYRGDKKIKKSAHGAGPIRPGGQWNERSSAFGLMDGINDIFIKLDPADLIEELDETNNDSGLRVYFANGQIIEKSKIYPASETKGRNNTFVSGTPLIQKEENISWGEVKNGLKCGLIQPAFKWKLEDPLYLSLILSNEGQKPFDFAPLSPEMECEIEVDGQWYGWAELMPEQFEKYSLDAKGSVKIDLSDSWALPKEGENLQYRPGDSEFWGKRLKINPGKHTFRVKFRPLGWLDSYKNGKDDLFVISEPIEIEYLENTPNTSLSENESSSEKQDEANQNKEQIVLQADVVTIKQPLSVVNDFLTNEIGLEGLAYSEITELQVQKFKEWAASKSGTNIASIPRTITSSGHSTKMSVTTSNEYTLRVNDVNLPDANQIDKEIITTGFILELVPELRKTSNGISVQINTESSEPIEKSDITNVSQLPSVSRRTISTKINIPSGKYCMISIGGLQGGLNSPPSLMPKPPHERIEIKTFLIIKAETQN